MNDIKKQRYLRRVRSELLDLPPEQRSAILADVESHIDEVTADGASIDNALERLGPARSLATNARTELSPGSAPSRVPVAVALALGVVTALVVAFTAPLWNAVARDETGAVTVALSTGPWTVILGAIPAAVVLVATAVRPLPARVILITLAGVLSVLAALGLTVLGWYLPFIAQLWVSILLPMATARGLHWPPALGWRVATGIVLVAPVLILFSREASLLTVVVLTVSVILAALWITGISLADYLTVGAGTALIVFSIAMPGTFMLATWWLGGLFVILGTAAFSARPRTTMSGALE